MTTMTVAQFPAANAALDLVTREVPEPGAGQVRQANEAFGRMVSGKARFRVVLTMG